mmetsp:Transcript_3915/g.5692  ORF Transcript_3915/g.5692 Transcript_3915/m.5692 type:complete len:168 (-) Transcript_3915:1317-1820(-)|eukprot:scaffold779_cov80-Skeletonema_marinoi.AAC.5
MKGCASTILVIVMAIATVTHGFSASSARRSSVAVASHSQLAVYAKNKNGGMDSYEAQLAEAAQLLASKSGTGTTAPPSPINEAAPTTAATTSAAAPSVEEIAAAMLDSSRAAVTAAQPPPQTIIIREPSSKEESPNGLTGIVYAGIGFVGLPLWLFLSSMFFSSTQQ